jgi:hypothetical protein
MCRGPHSWNNKLTTSQLGWGWIWSGDWGHLVCTEYSSAASAAPSRIDVRGPHSFLPSKGFGSQ